MPTQDEVKQQLKQDVAVASTTERRTIKDMLADPDRQLELAKALPNAMSPQRFARVLLNAVNHQPNLLQCDSYSLLAAGMQCAALGLEPNTPLQHCYLIPFDSKKGFQVQFILGYRGIIDLALRNNRVHSVEARPVFEKDEFEIDQGSAKKLVHVPYLDGNPGAIRFYYGISHFANGGYTFRPVPLWEIDEHREASKAKNSPAWSNWERAMSLKTCVRILAPFIPLSPEAATALAVDESTPQYNDLVASPIEADARDDLPETCEHALPENTENRCSECGEVDGGHFETCSQAKT